MNTTEILFTSLICFVILFQAGLSFGAPWGELSMGGKYPGRYPPKMRIVALINILVLLFIESIMLIRSNLIISDLFDLSRIAIWFVVVFFILGTVMNAITQSKWERIIWLPVNLVLLICSLLIALS